MSEYKYKQHEFFTNNFANSFKLSIDSLIEVDKIRITTGIQSRAGNPLMGLLIYSTLVNDYIGSAQTNYMFNAAGDYFYGDVIEPQNGIEFFYEKKIRLIGEFDCIITDFNGQRLNNPDMGYFSILVEYFAT